MSLLPIFLQLEGRPGLIVGAGTVALDKIGTLLKTGLRLRVIAPRVHPDIRSLADEGKLELIERPFEPLDLEGNFLVIAATDSPEVNTAVYRSALERNILCNSVDDIPNCDFFFGSIVRRGDLQIAISTAGQSPAFAQHLRHEIDNLLPTDIGPWLAELGQLRREILATHPRSEARKLLLHSLADRPVFQAPGVAQPALTRPVSTESGNLRGHVYLVGSGPGDPDLLTVKAHRIIQSADVILHDDLVPQAILDLAPKTAEILNVGKRCGVKNITQEEINGLMIEYAKAGRSVVRLKSGDPLIFGRAAEEMSALAEAGVRFEIVPGVTSALAAAAAAGVSLTSRNAASNVIFSTGHHAQSHNSAPLPEIEDATRVVYMPGRNLDLLALQWIQEGLPSDFPCAIVSRAAQPDQEIQFTTLKALGEIAQVAAPSLLLAGWAVRESVALRSTTHKSLPAR
ncbi:MAG TPA: siroheme synthase CysG [Terracidiphilus sp.]|nr:siroheme synthase CysG [Terracidiphilus sp.]